MISNLFVLFDGDCELCAYCKGWLQSQKQAIPLTFIQAGSQDAKRVFPEINHRRTKSELTVIADDGCIYAGTKAWLMVLWALADYRAWARSLASPEMMPIARKFITMISDNRQAINKMLPHEVTS
jgi:predicted DCC family thiol-disulfide oxidoreductase YuxK